MDHALLPSQKTSPNVSKRQRESTPRKMPRRSRKERFICRNAGISYSLCMRGYGATRVDRCRRCAGTGQASHVQQMEKDRKGKQVNETASCCGCKQPALHHALYVENSHSILCGSYFVSIETFDVLPNWPFLGSWSYADCAVCIQLRDRFTVET